MDRTDNQHPWSTKENKMRANFQTAFILYVYKILLTIINIQNKKKHKKKIFNVNNLNFFYINEKKKHEKILLLFFRHFYIIFYDFSNLPITWVRMVSKNQTLNRDYCKINILIFLKIKKKKCNNWPLVVVWNIEL